MAVTLIRFFLMIIMDTPAYVAPKTRKAQHDIPNYKVTATRGYAPLYGLTAMANKGKGEYETVTEVAPRAPERARGEPTFRRLKRKTE